MDIPQDKTNLLRSLAIDRGAKASLSPLPRRWGLPVILGGALILLGAAAFAPQLHPDGSVGHASQAATPQTSPPPAPGRLAQRPAGILSASGYVVARRKATVAAEISGKIVAVLVEEGMVVDEGQVVAKLDSVLAEKDLELAKSRADSAEAAIAIISADIEDANRILARVRALWQRNVASEADLTKAEARAGVLSAQLRQSKAQFETARLDAQRAAAVLEKHQIRAPFNGVVVDKSAQPGEMISPLAVGGFTRTGICTLVDMDSIEVEVDVNEAFISRVQAGMPVAAVLDAYPDWTIAAAVIAVVPTANREKATVKVRIGLKVKDPRILPDMAVKVTFETGGTAGDAARDKSVGK
jgi:RND family efflux transporter MFP subunit